MTTRRRQQRLRPVPVGGRCRFCGCSYWRPCPAGCGWANADETLCTECQSIARAFARTKPNPLEYARAFFRGFVVGDGDAERAIDSDTNPYRTQRRRDYWELGRLAAQAFARGRQVSA